MRSSFWAACIAAASCSSVTGQLVANDNITLPTSLYMTRPQANPPALNITVQDGFSQGYIFIAPYEHPGAGPYIFDKFGNLIWDGFGIVGSANAHDFKVCQYQGQSHLCLSQVNQQLGYAVGHALIIDSNYRIVASVQTGNDAMPADMHEFQLLDNGNNDATALVSSYRVIPYDLSNWNVTNGQGWLLSSMFQEIDVQTGAVLFEWYSHNHVDPSDAQVKIGDSRVAGVGDGKSALTPFDFFHLNSIDKSPTTGNYLVSARHTSTLYYVNATDMSIIWRLSYQGRSDFKCANFDFSFQHDARILAERETQTDISIFDNANDCSAHTSLNSSGRFITIDHSSGVATQTRQVLPPIGIGSCSQGNTQLLQGGSVFQGWGDKAWFSEHDANDNLVLAGTFTNGDISSATSMNYRAFSFEWQSTPANTRPQVYSYSLNTNSASQIHVSWNGATTVQTWRFYGGNPGSAFDVIGNATINGFETVWIAPQYYPYVMVEAVAWDGTSLANSSYQPTFVPSDSLAAFCSNSSCPAVTMSSS